MSRMEKVCTYPGGHVCNHCIWVSNDKSTSERYGMPFVEPYYTLKGGEGEIKGETGDFQGLTVIDSHNIFENAFNCIYGCKDEDCDTYHDYKNISGLFRGITHFVEEMNAREKNPIKKCRLVLNSNFKKERYMSKEHPHALLTVVEPKNFFEMEGLPTKHKKIKKVNSEPYKNDVLWKLNRDDCSKLIRAEKNNFMDVLNSILEKKRIKIRLTIDADFYIFLNYVFRKGKGTITGIISIDSKTFTHFKLKYLLEPKFPTSNPYEIIKNDDEDEDDEDTTL